MKRHLIALPYFEYEAISNQCITQANCTLQKYCARIDHKIMIKQQLAHHFIQAYNNLQIGEKVMTENLGTIQDGLARSLYFVMLNQLDEDIGRTNLPEFIVNFNQFQRWPKRLFKRYIIYDQRGPSAAPQLPSQIGKKIETALTKIYDRLSQLGQYGNLLKRKFDKEVQYFCPSLKKSNNIVEYSPSAIDKQLIKIVEYHQKQSGGKFKLSNQFENNIYLSELEEKIKIFYELQRKREKSLDQIIRMDKEINFLLGPFYREGFVDRHCLRCTTHFLAGTTTNACHPGISFYPIDAYELTSYDSFSNIENNVRASMCAMLNEPSGGIVLLGCERQGTQYIPKGLFITQKQKDSLQQKLEGYFIKIAPKVKRNQQIFIDFIPIMQLKQNTNSYSEQLFILEPVIGTYICRIIMIPKINYKVFLLKATPDHSSLEARINNQSVTVSQSEHYNFIIDKFQKFYGAGAESNQKLSARYCHYNVCCRIPAQGKYAYDKIEEDKPVERDDNYMEQQRIDRSCTSQTTKSEQVQKKSQQKPKAIDILFKKPEEFKLWTLVVGDKACISKLLECANEKQGKGIKIEQMYSQYKYKLPKTTWVMFHDEKFESMKKLAEKYTINYKNKQLKMIASNVYLEVEENLSQNIFAMLYHVIAEIGGNIKDYVNKEVEGKKVWIIWFDSLKASILGYYYLSDQNLKVRFIRGASHFKNSQANSVMIGMSTLNAANPANIAPQNYTGINNDQVGYGQMNGMQNYNPYYGYYTNGYNQGMYQPQTGYSNQAAYQQYQQQGYTGYPPQGYGNYYPPYN